MGARESDNIGTSLMDSALSDGAADIAGGVADLALDAVLDEGVLRDVPVFGWLVKTYGIGSIVRERIFLAKIARFLQATTVVSDQEREKFRKKLSANPEFSRKVGENLILLLDRHDNMEKAHILGKVFSGYLRGVIDYDAFLKIAAAVDRSFIVDLNNLEIYYEQIQTYDPRAGRPFAESLDDDTAQSLYTAGLVRIDSFVEETCHPNEMGSQLIRLMAE